MIFNNIKISWIQLWSQGPTGACFRWLSCSAVLRIRTCAQSTYWVQQKNCTGTEIFTSECQGRFQLTTITFNQLRNSARLGDYPSRSHDVILDYITARNQPNIQTYLFSYPEALVAIKSLYTYFIKVFMLKSLLKLKKYFVIKTRKLL